MNKQTAMQEMHDWLVDKWSDPSKLISCLEVMNKIEELLPKEKEQIKDAYKQGYRDGEHDGKSCVNNAKDISEFSNSETYYNETYANAKV
jgi:hypothetical protein